MQLKETPSDVMHFRRFSLFPLFSNFSDAAGYFGFLVRGIDSNLI